MQFNVKEPSKKFNPVTVELTFESQEEIDYLWHLSNVPLFEVKETGKQFGMDSSLSYCDIQIAFFRFIDKIKNSKE